MPLFTTNKDILIQIKDHIVKNPIKGSQVNTFTFDDKSYPLDTQLCVQIHKIMSNLSPKDEEKIIKKQYRLSKLLPKILAAIKSTVEETEKNKPKGEPFMDFFTLISIKDCSALALLINDQLSTCMLNKMWNNFSTEPELYQTSFTDLALNIGNTIITWFFEYAEARITYNGMTSIEQAKLFTYSNQKLQEFYTKNGTENFSCINIKFFEWFKKAHFIYLRSKTALESKTFFENAEFENINSIKNEEFIKLVQTIPVKLGAFLLEVILIKHKIIQEDVEKRTNTVTLCDAYISDITYARSYYKPVLTSFVTDEVSSQENFDQFKLKLRNVSRTDQMHKFKYNISSQLKDLIYDNSIHYCINTPFFAVYKIYLTEIYSKSFIKILTEPTSKDAEELINYIYMQYDINIDSVLKTINNKSFSKRLLNYIGDLNVIFDVKLSKFLKNKVKAAWKIYKKATEQHKNSVKSLTTLLVNTPNLLLEKLRYKISCAELMLDTFNKISAKKYFFISFIRDATLYEHFDHFVLQKEVSSIGRLQTIPPILSLQTDKLARGFIFVKTTENTVIAATFSSFKKMLSKKLYNVSQDINDLTFEAYIEKNKEVQTEYLASFFKDKEKKLELLKATVDLSTLSEPLNSLLKERAFKKSNIALLALSTLYYTLYPHLYENKYMEPLIYYDSTTSGTQHIATLFRNLKAATHSCLAGTEKVDVNLLFLNQFKSFIVDDLADYAKRYLMIFGLKREELFPLSETQLLSKIYNAICIKIGVTCKKYSCNTLQKLFDEIFIFSTSLQDIKEFTECILPNTIVQNYISILDNDLNKLHKEFYVKNDNLTNCLFIILLDNAVGKIFNTLPWLNNCLTSREIIKKRLMAEAYGMTERGGVYAIYDALKEKAFDQGIYKINFIYLRIFASIMSAFFSKRFRPETLDYMVDLVKLAKFTKYIKGPLTFSHEYLTWEYAPKKVKTIRVTMKSYTLAANEPKTKIRRRYMNIVYALEDIDKRKIRTALLAFIVQSIEAYLLMTWLMIGYDLNKTLKETFRIPFCCTPNYDCFGANFNNGALLLLTLKHSYLHNYKQPFAKYVVKMFSVPENKKQLQEAQNYIFSLINAFGPNYWDGQVTNRFFVKP